MSQGCFLQKEKPFTIGAVRWKPSDREVGIHYYFKAAGDLSHFVQVDNGHLSWDTELYKITLVSNDK